MFSRHNKAIHLTRNSTPINMGEKVILYMKNSNANKISKTLRAELFGASFALLGSLAFTSS